MRPERKTSKDRRRRIVVWSTVAVLVLGGVVAAVVVLVGGGGSTSSTKVPSLRLAPSTGHPGQHVVVTGTGFQPGEEVILTFKDRSAGTTVADENGAFRTTVVVPDLPRNGYLVEATGGSSGTKVSYIFSLTPG